MTATAYKLVLNGLVSPLVGVTLPGEGLTYSIGTTVTAVDAAGPDVKAFVFMLGSALQYFTSGIWMYASLANVLAARDAQNARWASHGDPQRLHVLELEYDTADVVYEAPALGAPNRWWRDIAAASVTVVTEVA